MSLLHSEHFVPRDALPIVPFRALAAAAMRATFDADVGAMVLADDLAPRFYLTAESFADLVEQRLGSGGQAASTTVLSVLGLRAEGGRWSTDLHVGSPGLLPVASTFVTPEGEDGLHEVLADPGNLVVPVVDGRGAHWGWVLNHESLAGTVHTRPPAYVCSIDSSHRFADPDHGRCRYCPGTLGRV